ncbi:hypothetical protein TPA0910_70600 [Streptomyces hygroscopicus subsp. sporocinereus]|uniref:Uncharacterized protein n=1 Tax=Streptomyces hygroscopicus TaxID=1912 RepID=A0ABQ3UAJ4_STRHY|nr:hypothetical protein TPA0910_70600 [Streptomyces hygroscopicus]
MTNRASAAIPPKRGPASWPNTSARTPKGGDQFLIGGGYEDRPTPPADGWRITRRRVNDPWAQGNPKVVGSTPARRENG